MVRLRLLLQAWFDWLLQLLMLVLKGSAEAEPSIQLDDSVMVPVLISTETLECAICMDAMQRCVQLVCGHQFHAACVNRWLHGDGHGRCPMCRQRALPMQANPPIRDGARWQTRRATESEERLVLAADQGDCETVSRLLADGVDPNALASHLDLEDNTPLTAAVAKGHAAVVRVLLDADGIDVNMDNEEGRTPLVCAAVNGAVAILIWLLNADGIDVNATPDGTDSALALASENGEKEVVRALLSVRGVEVNRAVGGWTPLDYAVRRGHTDIVDALRSAGAIHLCPLSVLRR